jgi:hypothetical protein
MDWITAALLILALLLANLPFFSERILFLRAAPGKGKHLGWRLLELVILYVVTGAVAWLLEARAGQVHRQSWEFYAITASLFLVFAYPGYVYRYLWRKPGL